MPLKPAILLDSNAGAPLHPAVKEALFAFLDSDASAGNPASVHAFGRRASSLVAEAESAILRTVHAPAAEWKVTFTGSGTEANQLAVRAALLLRARQGSAAPSVWAVSEIEHACVLDLIPEIERAGVEIRRIKPDSAGAVSDLGAAEGASLFSVIGVGNETGIVHHPVTSHILSSQFSPSSLRPIIHTDFAAGWGKAPLDLSGADAPDLVAIAGHKLGGLPGSGALIHRKSIPVERSGTPNLAGIVGMRALADRWSSVTDEMARLAPVRDAFEAELTRRFPAAIVTGKSLARAPNVTHFHFPGLSKDLSLVTALDLRGFAVSACSACASGATEPSHVLRAMGMSDLDARNALRVSLHPKSKAEDLTDFLEALGEVLKRHELF